MTELNLPREERHRELRVRQDSSKNFLHILSIFVKYFQEHGHPPTFADVRTYYYKLYDYFPPKRTVYRWLKKLEILGMLKSNDNRPYSLTPVGEYLSSFNLKDFQDALEKWLKGQDFVAITKPRRPDVKVVQESIPASKINALRALYKRPVPKMEYSDREKVIFEYGFRMAQSEIAKILGDSDAN